MNSVKQEGWSRATAIMQTGIKSVLDNTTEKMERVRQVQDTFWRQTQLNLSLSQFKKLGKLWKDWKEEVLEEILSWVLDKIAFGCL